MSVVLADTLAAWGSPDFAAVSKREFEALDPASLPLQQALAFSSVVADEPFHVRLIAADMRADALELKVGVLYAGVIAGCNCADDPTPPATQTEYCVLRVEICREDGRAQVELAPED